MDLVRPDEQRERGGQVELVEPVQLAQHLAHPGPDPRGPGGDCRADVARRDTEQQLADHNRGIGALVERNSDGRHTVRTDERQIGSDAVRVDDHERCPTQTRHGTDGLDDIGGPERGFLVDDDDERDVRFGLSCY
ncbi:hypothetical protein [Isoptericola rhizosphaerae]|uniref:hypothetical protein n=1 Tax=Isoptericola rhizosphaerae TaxID=3377837 RepID=UPI00383BE5BB